MSARRGTTATRPDRRSPEDERRIVAIFGVLKPRLVHTREVLDGVDFLFSGPEDEVLEALRGIAALEQGKDPLPRVDFVRLEGYVLLRVYGSSDLAQICKSSLLDPEGPPAG